jgi:hypothetical protein
MFVASEGKRLVKPEGVKGSEHALPALATFAEWRSVPVSGSMTSPVPEHLPLHAPLGATDTLTVVPLRVNPAEGPQTATC